MVRPEIHPALTEYSIVTVAVPGRPAGGGLA